MQHCGYGGRMEADMNTKLRFYKGCRRHMVLLAMLWVKSIANKIFKFDEKYWMLLAILTTYVGVKTYHCFVFPWSVQCGMTASLFLFWDIILEKMTC